ncbi:MAG: M20/M25/M40 family metallo-hydrolase [Vicinamibacterales bacterium]
MSCAVRRVVVGAAAAFAVTASLAGQPSDVRALMQEPAMRTALARARATEPQTLDDQIRFCQVPAPPFDETARGELLRRAFAAVGLRNVRVDEVGNVLGDRPGAAARPRVVLAAHLDTVFPKGTAVTVTRDGAELKGPGIGDNCRGLAVLVAVARTLREADVRTAGSLTFVANVGEEGLGDLRGMRTLFGRTLKGQIDRFVTIDNAGLQLSIVGVGSRRYRVTFHGPGGHSYADFGRANPADALGRAIAKLAEFRTPGAARTTFNVGRIGGGTSVNAIPAEAWMEVDLRSPDPGALKELESRFEAAVDAAVAEENTRWGRAAQVTVEKRLVGDRPAGATPSHAPISQTAESVAMALGLPRLFSEASSDANLPMSLGIPAIAIGGGGRSFGSHTTDERFDGTDAWQGTQFALLLAAALARN